MQPSVIKDIARRLNAIETLHVLTIFVSDRMLIFTLEIADRVLVIDRRGITHFVSFTSGHSSKSFSRTLQVTRRTIESDRVRSCTKLGVRGLPGLTKLALRADLTSVEDEERPVPEVSGLHPRRTCPMRMTYN